MLPTTEDFYRLAPVIVLCVSGMAVMLGEAFVPRAQRGRLATLALLGGGAALAAVGLAARHPGTAFSGLVVIDDFSLFLHFVVIGVALLAILGSVDYLKRENIHHGEYHALILLGSAGMILMASAGELMVAFIGLEISSISTYILAGYRRDVLKSNESAMKYFLLGSFATAFFLYGIALLYGATGTTQLERLGDAIGAGAGGSLVPLGLAMLFVGLAFKVATVPFQIWTPDAYEGAPTPVAALLSTAPKAAVLALLLRIFFTAFGEASDLWYWAIWISAALTMCAGNLGALVQSNVKRMLAYSSIAHAGYIFVALAARGEPGVAAILFYVVAYAMMKLGAFTVVAHLGGAAEQRVEISDYAGLGTRQPVTAACFSLFLLSLLGLPLTAGFLGKFYVFQAALETHTPAMTWLVILAAVNTVIGAYYYLRVIVVMYMREPEQEWTPAPVPAGVGIVLFLTAAGTIYFGLFPGAVIEFASQSALALR